MTASVTEVFEKSQNKRPLWTVNDVAAFLGVRPRTIYDWVYRRCIPYLKVGRALRFSPDAIELWALQKPKE